MTPDQLSPYLQKIQLPLTHSHKGQNGKVLVIGGSELFHAASQWSLLVVSRMVDMVFYSSVPANNALITESKQEFHNGIVIPREHVEEYIEEAGVVLIGPGMTRERIVDEQWRKKLLSGCTWETTVEGKTPPVRVRRRKNTPLSSTVLDELKKEIEWKKDTYAVVNYLLAKYPHKKWVVDAGALQMCEPALLNANMIITPHEKELQTVFDHLKQWVNEEDQGEDIEIGGTHFVGTYHQFFDGLLEIETLSPEEDQEYYQQMIEDTQELSRHLNLSTILLKGPVDKIISKKSVELIKGGNEGMTKGGTGDVLAGLIAGLYAFTNEPFAAAVVGSYVNKAAGDELYKTVGPFFNASDLANQIPHTLSQLFHFK